MPVEANALVVGVTFNSPNPSELAKFYSRLLGWEVTNDEGGWVELQNTDGGISINFHIEDHYQWPV